MLGGPERRSKREAGESIETLFHAYYPQIVSSTFARVGDWDLSGQLAMKAYLRLWRNRRLMTDPSAALQYLRRLAAKSAGKGSLARNTAGRQSDRTGSLDRAGATESLDRAGAEARRRAIDTRRAWGQFEELRARSAARRRRALTAGGSAVIAALVITVPLLTSSHSVQRMPPPSVRLNAPSPPRAYRRAIVARFELSGVISVVGVAMQAWAVRSASQPATIEQPAAAGSYQLVGLDLRNNTITYRVNLGRQPRAVAAGAGKVWLTTPSRQAGGQIVRLNPATGRVVQTLHLPTGRCTDLVFGYGHLFAACRSRRPGRTDYWTINPVSARAFRLAGPLRTGPVLGFAAAPDALWWVSNIYSTQVDGLAHLNASRPKHVTVSVPGAGDAWSSLAYDSGSVWVLSGVERVARIDAVTGKVVKMFTYRSLDPARTGGLDYLTAGDGWLWFLDNGYPFSGVVRVSESTGRPVGGVAIASNSCGHQVCSQIFYTPESVWVPIAGLLIRIDPGRLPV
jgi:DNA-directed RNA polymerase specialized sigma24 family protein